MKYDFSLSGWHKAQNDCNEAREQAHHTMLNFKFNRKICPKYRRRVY